MSKLASVVAATGMFVFAAGSTATAAAAFEPRPLPFQRGVDLVDWGSDGYGQRGVETQLRQIKSHMGTSVTLVQTWSQDTLTSSSVRPGSHAVPDTRLVAAIRAARKMGLSVVLRPYIDVNGGLWRGRAKPLDRAAWFASYRNFALHYAELARREKVSIFIFATEMVDLSIAAPDDWRALAAAVRSEFPGPVGYAANWGDDLNKSSWFDALDFIAVSAYYPTCRLVATDDVNSLVNQWMTRHVNVIGSVAERFQRPVMFSEIGYRPMRDACLQPWNTSLIQPMYSTAQVALYEAAFRVWWNAPRWFRGLHWWGVSPRGRRKPPRDHDPLPLAWLRISAWFGTPAAGDS